MVIVPGLSRAGVKSKNTRVLYPCETDQRRYMIDPSFNLIRKLESVYTTNDDKCVKPQTHLEDKNISELATIRDQ